MAKEKEFWQELGVSEEKYKEIILEVEHAHVDYRLTGLDEVAYAKKLFPKMSSEDMAKIIYFGRVQWWAGHNVKDP